MSLLKSLGLIAAAGAGTIYRGAVILAIIRPEHRGSVCVVSRFFSFEKAAPPPRVPADVEHFILRCHVAQTPFTAH